MNKKITSILTSLGIAASGSLAFGQTLDTKDINQIFSSQGNAVALSTTEMKETKGAYSILSALVGLSSLNLAPQTWQAITLGIKTGAIRVNPIGFIQSIGLNPNIIIPQNPNNPAVATETLASSLIGLSVLGLYPQTWDVISAGITNGSFQADPTRFIRNLGIDPNFSLPKIVNTTTSPSR